MDRGKVGVAGSLGAWKIQILWTKYFSFLGRSSQATQQSSLDGYSQGARNLLVANELPDYVLLLLGLYGVRTLKDLKEFSSEDVDEIIQLVRSRSFGGIELSSRLVKMKYLGGEYPDLTLFTFKPMDKKKLNRISESAANALDEEANKEALQSREKVSLEAAASTRKRWVFLLCIIFCNKKCET